MYVYLLSTYISYNCVIMSTSKQEDSYNGAQAGSSSTKIKIPSGLSENEIMFYKKAAKYLPNGIKERQFSTEIPDIPIETVMQVINSLSRKGLIEIIRSGADNAFKVIKVEDAGKMADLDNEAKLVYQHIRAAGNEGIWTKYLKTKTNLHQNLITQCLKKLEQKQLVKSVKHVKYPTRKVYMLAELTPSLEVTGGAWYTDQELDVEFIENVTKAIYKFVAARSVPRNNPTAVYPSSHMGFPTAAQVRRWVIDSKISAIDLSLQDVTTLLNVLIYDGKIERVVNIGAGGDDMDWSEDEADEEGGDGGGGGGGSENEICYKAVRERGARGVGIFGGLGFGERWTDVPCGRCPVFKFCKEDGPVSPFNCEYFNKWLLDF